MLSLFVFVHGVPWAQTTLPSVSVEGRVDKPLTLYVKDVNAMQQSTVFFKDFSGHTYSYSGVAVQEILKQAGLSSDREEMKDYYSQYVLAIGADGSESVFSMAEIDSILSGQRIILANKINGQPLPEGLGPFRLVVSGEANRVRWLWEVNRLVVRYAHD